MRINFIFMRINYLDLETTLKFIFIYPITVTYASVTLCVMCFVSDVSGVTVTCGVFELALPSKSYVY